MAKEIVNAILPDVPLGNLGRRVATAAILLSPVVLLVGFIVLVRTSPQPAVHEKIDAPQAIAIARAFVIGKGIPAASWNASSGFQDDKILLKVVNARPTLRPLWSVAPPLYVRITLQGPAENQKVRVSLSLEGKIIGFDGESALPDTAPLPDAEALRRAEAQLPTEVQFDHPSIQAHGATRLFIFRSTRIPGVELKEEIREKGKNISFVQATATPDPSDSSEANEELQDGLIIAGCFFAFLMACFSIYRYAVRSIQRELSHKRSILVALLCGGFCCLIASNATNGGDNGGISPALILLAFGLVGFVGGLFLAAAYGSGEGDVREAYPGKLTSLDALLTGRIFSRNVGVSLVFGFVCSGWVTFVVALAMAPFRSSTPRSSEEVLYQFTHNGWLIGLVIYPLASVALSAGGLLQPLAVLQIYFKKARRWHLPILVLCSVLMAVIHSNAATNAEFLCRSAGIVVALLLPFFLRDLLATLVCVSYSLFLLNLASMLIAMPDLTLMHQLYMAAGPLLFIAALVCVRFGKTVTEEQVRPLYARHIAQRKALEAEVSAAREAQLRLMPQCVPEFKGLTIAASCVPAETVGGDFYDFFQLADGRLGIFIAEGNNRGLAAALTIALAKGYLMHCVGRVREPVDILVRLETALSAILETTSGLTEFAFATIDTVRGEIRYARTGVYPKVIINSGRDPSVERLVQIAGRQEPITSGSAVLEAGDHILLFTDGIGRRLESSGKLLLDRATGAEEARKRVMSTAKRDGAPDDLTVIVVQVQHVGAPALEVVA